MTDLISRADAMAEFREWVKRANENGGTPTWNDAVSLIGSLPSAEAEPIVIRAKTLMRKEDFDKWAEDIKRQGENVICIPCDAEVVSADAVHGWRTDKPTEQGKYMVTIDSFGHKRIDLFHYGKPMMPNRKVKGMCWYRSHDEWGDVVYDDTDILAWQPLPKPYRDESEVEE